MLCPDPDIEKFPPLMQMLEIARPSINHEQRALFTYGAQYWL